MKGKMLTYRAPSRTMRVCSSSSPMMRTKKLISAIVPAEFTAPGVLPSGSADGGMGQERSGDDKEQKRQPGFDGVLGIALLDQDGHGHQGQGSVMFDF